MSSSRSPLPCGDPRFPPHRIKFNLSHAVPLKNQWKYRLWVKWHVWVCGWVFVASATMRDPHSLSYAPHPWTSLRLSEEHRNSFTCENRFQGFPWLLCGGTCAWRNTFARNARIFELRPLHSSSSQALRKRIPVARLPTIEVCRIISRVALDFREWKKKSHIVLPGFFFAMLALRYNF